jgi:putative transposase
MARRKEPQIPDAILDQLLSGTEASAAFDQGGLLDQLKKALAERALNAEMDHHLAGDAGAGNSRNGYGRKSVVTDTGRMALAVPRDRQASFDPLLIAKYQRRFPGFDDKIISMYARGMSTREIGGHLLDLYGVEVPPDLISTVTDAVLDEIATWQARPLEPVYPLVFFDALRVKIRDGEQERRRRRRKPAQHWSATRRCTSRLACGRTAPRKSWAFGWSRTRVPSSGCAS